MSYLADAFIDQKPSASYGEAGILAYLAPDPPNAETYINVRLSNGTGYYNAGGTTVSGGSALSADQGSPNLISAAWPVKVTDGTTVMGTTAAPFNVTFTSGGLSVGDAARPIWITGSVFVLNPSSGGPGSNVTVQSGSVVGLLVGGQPVAGANPVPISDAGGSITVDGALIAQSGSIVGLMVGGVALSLSNPMPVTGTVSLSQAVSVAGIVSVTGTVALSRAVDIATMPNVTIANPQTTITVISGSVTGLLVGGVATSNANPVPVSQQGTATVTGTVALSRAIDIANMPSITIGSTVTVTGTVHMADVSAVTGTVALSRAIDIANMPNVTVANPQTTVTVISGSITGLLVGGQAASNANPVPVNQQGTVTTSTTLVSGSQTGLLVGSNPVAASNPLPITGTVALSRAIDIANMPNVTVGNVVTVTGTVHMADVSAVTGTVALARAVDVATMPSVTQGTAAALNAPWRVQIVSGGDVIGQTSNPLWVTGSVFMLNPGGAGSNVVAQSGSVTGLLVGGVALSSENPLPVTGTVALARAIDVSTLPAVSQGTAAALSAPWRMQLVSGGDVVGQTSNPLWVTGSVFVINQGGAGSNVTAQSGSVTGLLVGGVALSSGNPIPVTGTVALARAVDISTVAGVVTVTGTVHMADVSAVTGTVALARGVDIATMPAVAQGTAAALSAPWRVQLVSGSDVVGQTTNPMWVTGSVFVINQGGAGSNVVAQSGSVTGLLVGGVALAGSNPLPVTGTVHLADVSAITGSVVLAAAPHVFHDSGSVTGLLVGGVAVSNANPVPVSQQGTITTNTTLISGSQTGLLMGANPVAVSNPLAVVNVSGSITGLLIGGLALNEANPLPTRDQRAGTATVTSLTASVTSQLLKTTLATRLGMTFYNDSVANAYLKWGGSVATNDFSFKMLPDDYYEVPYGHTGRIDVIWTAATGSMRITEFT